MTAGTHRWMQFTIVHADQLHIRELSLFLDLHCDWWGWLVQWFCSTGVRVTLDPLYKLHISPSLLCGYICKQIQVSLKTYWEITCSNAVVFPPTEPTFLLGYWIPMWNLTHSQIIRKILWFFLLQQFLCLMLICFHGINWGLSLVAAQIPCS